MKLGMINLITKTADLPTAAVPPIAAKNLRPQTDCDLNIVELSRHISCRGHEVTVFAADAFMPKVRCPPEPGLGIDYLRTVLPKVFPAAIFPFTPDLAKRLRHGGYEAVLTAELFQSGTLLSWFAAKDLRTRMLVWQELDVLMRGPAGRAQSIYYRTLGRKVVADMVTIVPRSLSARRHLINSGVPEEKISHEAVHSGVDCGIFHPIQSEKARDHLGLQAHDDVLLCVARLHPNKGLDRIIRAMPRLLERRPSAVLLIKGSGPQLEELRSLVGSLGLQDKIRIITEVIPRDDMPYLFSAADMLVVTSRIDLFPFTAIESISCGVPVATSFARGLKTDIVDQGAGMMLPEALDGISDELASLLEDKQRLRSAGSKGRELALKEFDFEVGAKRLERAFKGEDG
ncbi:MAG: glycosyltransferase family 4 protein [Methanomassiliicoccales archaeon]|nr:glycosyltransferase family 4 protein [Methanomassiliicoccales archaeon]